MSIGKRQEDSRVSRKKLQIIIFFSTVSTIFVLIFPTTYPKGLKISKLGCQKYSTVTNFTYDSQYITDIAQFMANILFI